MSAFVCLENQNDFIEKLHAMVDNGEVTTATLVQYGVPSWYANLIMTKKTHNQIPSDFLDKLAEVTKISVVEILRQGGLISKHAVAVAAEGLKPSELHKGVGKKEINKVGANLQDELNRIRKEVRYNESNN